MAYPRACMKQDLDGRVPLHFACDSDRALYEEDLKSTKNTSLDIDTIRCLVSFAPKSVLVDDIDEIVRAVRFDGWQATHAGEREVKKALRQTLFKYKLHQDAELFERAYGYIREYY